MRSRCCEVCEWRAKTRSGTHKPSHKLSVSSCNPATTMSSILLDLIGALLVTIQMLRTVLRNIASTGSHRRKQHCMQQQPMGGIDTFDSASGCNANTAAFPCNTLIALAAT